MKEKLLVGKEMLKKTERGYISERFTTLHENLCLRLRLSAEAACAYSLIAYNTKAEREVIYTAEPKGEAELFAEYRFDPISLAVYHDSKEFEVEINSTGAVEVLEFAVVEEYDESVAKTEPVADFTRVMDDGTMGVLIKRIDGKEELVPTIPKKAIIMGNSLVLGMFNAYGMCASASDKDYFHYVTEEIKKYNPDCQCIRMHGSGFEQSPGDEGYSKWMYDEPNVGTGIPTYLSFTPDVDLIIIQLTDNVNTDEKVVDFNARIDKFLDSIRTMCPKARIIWVHGWYNDQRTAEKLTEVCEARNIARINIKYLCTIPNQARHQKYAKRPDGTVTEIPDRWISHPGDIGMKKIADRIISVLKLG